MSYCYVSVTLILIKVIKVKENKPVRGSFISRRNPIQMVGHKFWLLIIHHERSKNTSFLSWLACYCGVFFQITVSPWMYLIESPPLIFTIETVDWLHVSRLFSLRTFSKSWEEKMDMFVSIIPMFHYAIVSLYHCFIIPMFHYAIVFLFSDIQWQFPHAFPLPQQ